MISITVRFTVRPEHADRWLERTRDFTEATRAEPGNLWFDWFRSVEDPTVFLLTEAFEEGDAPGAHVNSRHFAEGLEAMRPLLVRTPEIVSTQVDQDGWGEMGELTIP